VCARTIRESIPCQKECWSRVTLRSDTEQGGALLIVGWVAGDIRSEKGEYGEAIIVEEKFPVMTCAEAERAARAASPFFRFTMRIVKRASLNQTQKPVRTILWFRSNHAIRSALHHVRGQQTIAVTNGGGIEPKVQPWHCRGRTRLLGRLKNL
jgi:hypothetical protein